MSLSESDTRAKLIDPALHLCGWTEDLIRREETEQGIDIIEGKPIRRHRGRTDYLLRLKVNLNPQPFAIALVEAKPEDDPPDKGLQQGKKYARLNNVPYAYSTNGHLYVEYDALTGKTSRPRAIKNFPSPLELRQRYEQELNIKLDNQSAKPLLMSYPGGEASRRYYQDAAIRSTLTNIVQGKKHMLLFLATGSGKTLIAVHILKKIADAGQLHRALFLCDRDELRTQGLGAFQNIFGSDAAEVSGSNPQKNARVLIATYQTLNVASDTEDAKFFLDNYPKNYFSHIIIDECHRSAWGKWSIILKNNPDAIQIGLTATPRSFTGGKKDERKEDEQITANNIDYFGAPIYEYPLTQGVEDGYLAACEVIRREVNLDIKGVSQSEIAKLGAKDATTGQPVNLADTRAHYESLSFESIIQLPDRVKAMCQDLFKLFLKTGGPLQKTIIFCTRDTHADAVAIEMNNLYTDWCAPLEAHANKTSKLMSDFIPQKGTLLTGCAQNNQSRVDNYAFKCTAAVGGSQYIADLRGSLHSHFIATTVDLITTGVDVPCVRNVVFFKYVRSPIAFSQMMGRGTRIHPPTNKLMYRVYDYTNATRLLGREFKVHTAPTKEKEPPGERKEKIIKVEGFDVHINPAGQYIVAEKDGKPSLMTIEEYRQRIAEHLFEQAKTLDDFRNIWIEPERRRVLLEHLPDGSQSVRLLKELTERKECDDYDVLAEIGYGMAPLTRTQRADALQYKHYKWLKKLPTQTVNTLLALVEQFARGGTDELENPYIFKSTDVINAGGLDALKVLGEPKDIITETKKRLFAA